MRTCSVEGCDKKHKSKGLCTGHYQRMWTGKTSDTPIRAKAKTDEEREALYVDKSGGPDACWPWTGARSGPYGRVGAGELAHRWMYSRHIGPIPEGKTIDHVRERGCTSTMCVNPAHLEAVWFGENIRRGAEWRRGAEELR